MIEKVYAKQQIARLSSIPFFPQTVAGAKELVDALMQAARSDDHAKRTIDEFCRNTCDGPKDGPRCPTPGEIIRTAWSLLSDSEKSAGIGCPACDFTGFVITEREDGTSGARPCTCRPTPKAPEAPSKPTSTLHRPDPRMLAAGGAE